MSTANALAFVSLTYSCACVPDAGLTSMPEMVIAGRPAPVPCAAGMPAKSGYAVFVEWSTYKCGRGVLRYVLMLSAAERNADAPPRYATACGSPLIRL